MKIGHYMTGLNRAGGVASYIRRISMGQKEMGHEVVLIDRTDGSSSEPVAQGILFTRNDAELYRLAHEHRLDVLHLHAPADSTTLPVKIVRTMHGHWPYCPSGSRFFKRQGEACNRRYSLFGCSWGHAVDRCGSIRPAEFALDFKRTWWEMRTLPGRRVLAISEFVKSQMIRSGYAAGDIHVLYLPAPSVTRVEEVSGGERSSSPPSFVFLGRLVPEKGAEWLLRASAAVKGEFTLEIAGDGTEGHRLANLAKQLGIAKRVHFHGWLKEPEVLSLILNARAVVFPSIWHEPAGLVTLEAAALGRAAIASRVGGIPEYAELLGNTILVDPSNIPELSMAMQRLLDQPQEASTLGSKGNVEAHGKLSLAMHIQRLSQHYEEAM